MKSPLHNAIGPFVKLKEAGVRTYLGIDDIADLFMPIVDGDMWTEAWMLMEACRYYDLEQVADWATKPPLHILNQAYIEPCTCVQLSNSLELHILNLRPSIHTGNKEEG